VTPVAEGPVAAQPPVGLPGVLEAAATRAAGDDTTDRAQLHGSRRWLGSDQRAVMPPSVRAVGLDFYSADWAIPSGSGMRGAMLRSRAYPFTRLRAGPP